MKFIESDLGELVNLEHIERFSPQDGDTFVALSSRGVPLGMFEGHRLREQLGHTQRSPLRTSSEERKMPSGMEISSVQKKLKLAQAT